MDGKRGIPAAFLSFFESFILGWTHRKRIFLRPVIKQPASFRQECLVPYRYMLFIYGTLRAGCRNRHHIEPYIGAEESASTVGTLFMRDGYRSPFLNIRGDTRVAGDLIELKGDEATALKELDVAEGPYYVRKEITAQRKGGTSVKVWAYVSNWEDVPNDAELIESGDYLQYLAEGGRPI
jgi:gamma-glutamylcyclotransferase (GGCT)/AIG2-like uncharacterized protein YtfP